MHVPRPTSRVHIDERAAAPLTLAAVVVCTLLLAAGAALAAALPA